MAPSDEPNLGSTDSCTTGSELDAQLDQLPTTMRGYFRRYTNAYVVGGVCLAGFQLALNRIDWLSKYTVDRVFGHMGHTWLWTGLGMIGLALFAFGLRLASRWYLFNAGREAEYEIRAQLLHRLHRLGASFYRRMSPGEIMSRATADLAQVRLLFGFGVLNVVNVVFAFASALQVMLRISPRLSGAAFVVTPLLVISTRAFSKRMFAATRVNQGELARLGDLAQRHFAGIRVVRSFAIEKFAETRFGEAARRYLTSGLQLARIRGAMFPLLGAINATSLLVVAWYGADLLRRGPAEGGISSGDLFAFLLAWTRMAWPLTSFGLTISVLQRGRVCFDRLRELIITAPDVVEPEPGHAGAADGSGLRVTNLSYELGGRAILKDVSLELPAGRSLAIVGRTGSGKSTLAMLMVRLLPTQRQTVFLDGRDVCDLDRSTLRQRVGYAQQDPFLFSTSIAENVAIGLDLPTGASIPPAELHEALRDAQISDEVALLPDASDTLVGERGVQLSGGQRQRVSLARALVSHTPLLILDDPLSAVDARTEAAILDALRRRAELRSLVLITHRISAAARCDQVLVLDEGRVVQCGTHAQLVEEAGVYATLAEEQRVEGELDELAGTEVAAAAVATVPATMAARPVVNDDELPTGTDLGLLRRLWPYLKDERSLLVLSMALLGLMTGVGLLRPIVMGNLMGAAKGARSLVLPGVELMAVLIGASLLSFGQNYATQVAGARGMVHLREALFVFTDRLGMRVFDRMPVGRLVTRVVNDVDAVGELFATGAINAIGDLVTLLALFVMMIGIDWKMALISFVSVPVIASFVQVMRRGARTAYRETRLATSQLNAMLNEQVTGIAVVQAFGRESAMAQRFDVVNRSYRAGYRKAILAESALDAGIEMVQTVCIASVLLWAGHEVMNGGAVTFALIVTFQQALRQFFEPVSFLALRFTTVQLSLASAERIFQLLDSTELEPLEEEEPLGDTGQLEQLCFEHVGFAYRTGRPVLTDVSFTANRGERIALVGPTGAGKSTVTQLLLRLYDADEGQVRVLGRDVKRWSRATLRRAFSVVPQEVTLFSGTLLDNIALGDPAPDRVRAERALDRLGLRDSFLSREGGLDARVDERGLNFSVGERQLLSFARAVYNDSPILLLDEATANVDSHTEARIQTALAQLLEGRTALVIAHRLSTIESSDRILVFQAGRVVESGTHKSLLEQHGLYAKLHALQAQKSHIVAA